MRGNRARKADIEKQIEQERNGIWSLYWACSEYAKTNNGTGPNTWGDLRAASDRIRGAGRTMGHRSPCPGS